MLMTSFLNNRKSVRDFKNKKVKNEELNNLREYLKELGKEIEDENIKFNLIENGEELFENFKGVGGYSGVMIQSPHYISLELLNNEDNTLIYGSYYMEKLITKLNQMGLCSCWVSVGNVSEEIKSKIFKDSIGKINYILAFGYGKPKNPFLNETFSERIGVEELVCDGKLGNPTTIEDLESRGLGDLFYYVRFAPSTFNKQPWRFILEKDNIKLVLKYNKDEELNLIDGGIIMYYFEALGETIGINSKWKLLDLPVVEEGDSKYKYIGEIKL